MMRMSFNCPVCQSENTQLLSAIYAGGTSTIHSHTTHAINGTTYGSNGFGVVTGTNSSSTQTNTQSLLANRFSPPQPKIEKWIFATITLAPTFGFLAAGGFLFIAKDIPLPWLIIQLAFLCVMTYVAYRTFKHFKGKANEGKKYNQTTYQELMRQWRTNFYCHKCSTVFDPNQ
jgi:hypothetical protein